MEAHRLSRKRKGRPIKSTREKSSRQEGMHIPEKIRKENGNVLQKECYMCRLVKKRKVTSFICKQCDVRLCIGSSSENCFQKFHSLQKLPKGASTPPHQNNSAEFSQVVPESEEIYSENTYFDQHNNLEVLVPESQYP